MPGLQRHTTTGPSPSDEPATSALASVARGADALRSGNIIVLQGDDEQEAAVLAVEPASADAVGRFERASGDSFLLLTHPRAKTLKMRLYASHFVALRLAEPLDPDTLRAIADPTGDLSRPLKGPFETFREPLPQYWSSATKLAKLSGLLPAVLVGSRQLAGDCAVSVPADAIANYQKRVIESLKIVTRARIPLEGAERAELVAFRAGSGEPENIAILIGDPPPGRPVLTRLHSECFTGDLLGSLRCDCGEQLRGAIETIAQRGGGVLLYLAQEGRGIGLINKLRAYRLQDQGFDTLEANERLGFEDDERLYGIPARMLLLLGFKSIRLMTNNPHKIDALRAAGIDVRERVPHAFPANSHNRDYLRTKSTKSGHFL